MSEVLDGEGERGEFELGPDRPPSPRMLRLQSSCSLARTVGRKNRGVDQRVAQLVFAGLVVLWPRFACFDEELHRLRLAETAGNSRIPLGDFGEASPDLRPR